MGVSLTSDTRDITKLWEEARYDLKPRFLQIPGVARVDLVGGKAPEYQVVVDPLLLQDAHLSLADVTDALDRNNLVASAGMHEENHTLYLTVVDGRVHGIQDIEDFVVAAPGRAPRAHQGLRPGAAGPRAGLQHRHRRRPCRRPAQHPQPARRQHAQHRRRAPRPDRRSCGASCLRT